MLLAFAVILPAVCGVHVWDANLSGWHYDKSCKVGRRAFTGIRIQFGWGVQLYPLEYQEKQIVITKCDGGSVEYEFELPTSVTLFNRDIEVPSSGEHLRFVRRNAYRNSTKLSYLLPQTLLGAAYIRAEDDNDWRPLSPLVSDHWGTAYFTTVMRRGKRVLAVRESLLRSSDVLEKDYPRNDDWAALLLPYEENTL